MWSFTPSLERELMTGCFQSNKTSDLRYVSSRMYRWTWPMRALEHDIKNDYFQHATLKRFKSIGTHASLHRLWLHTCKAFINPVLNIRTAGLYVHQTGGFRKKNQLACCKCIGAKSTRKMSMYCEKNVNGNIDDDGFSKKIARICWIHAYIRLEWNFVFCRRLIVSNLNWNQIR